LDQGPLEVFRCQGQDRKEDEDQDQEPDHMEGEGQDQNPDHMEAMAVDLGMEDKEGMVDKVGDKMTYIRHFPSHILYYNICICRIMVNVKREKVQKNCLQQPMQAVLRFNL